MKTAVIESIKTFKVVLLLFSFLISSCSRNEVESYELYEAMQVDYGSIDLVFIERFLENVVKQDLGCEYVIFQENDSSFNEQSHYKFVFGYAFELYYEKENTLLLEKEYEFLPLNRCGYASQPVALLRTKQSVLNEVQFNFQDKSIFLFDTISGCTC